MTDNEKRAHDLTLLYMYGEIRNGQIETQPKADFSDYFLDYKHTYTSMLNLINEWNT